MRSPIYSLIIFLTFFLVYTILSSKTEDCSESIDSTSLKELPLCNYLAYNIEDRDSIFNLVEDAVARNLEVKEYSYDAWKEMTEELFGVETCTHSSDYDYSNHEIRLLDFLNWHLLKRISTYFDEDILHEIESDIILSQELVQYQCQFIHQYLSGQDTRYDECGLYREYKSILNDNFVDLYTVLTKGLSHFEQRKITSIDAYPYECEYVSDELVEKEYQRFFSECIPIYFDEPRNSFEIECISSRLANEHKAWERFIAHRNKVEAKLTGDLAKIWAYATKVWKLNKIRQLKNEFECYGTMSELDYKLSLQDCNYTELMNYYSFSNEWELNIKH